MPSHIFNSYLVFLILINATIAAKHQNPWDPSVLTPSDSRLRLKGRFDQDNTSQSVGFSWVMSGLECVFNGSLSIWGTFSGSMDGARLMVLVDGVEFGDFFVNASFPPTEFLLASNLSLDGQHILQVFKITEDKSRRINGTWNGIMRFFGFRIQKDRGIFLPLFPAQLRKIEFIGDSDTSGWCANGQPHVDSDQNIVQNGYISWSQQLARDFSADTMTQAISGWGVTNSSMGAVQSVLNNINTFVPEPQWDYSQWIPDAVIILIGPNDKPGLNLLNGYINLLDLIARNYRAISANIKIINVCGGSSNGLDVCVNVAEANQQFNAKVDHPNVKSYFISVSVAKWTLINTQAKFQGCAHHYNILGHRIIADDLRPQITRIMQW